MTRISALMLALLMLLSVQGTAMAVNEDVEGVLAIYSSMYPFMNDLMDAAIRKEFPNLVPAFNGSFFFYAGASQMVTRVLGEMGRRRDQDLNCDMLLVAEPGLTLELKDCGYLHPFEVENAAGSLRFPCDPDGCWYPVRVCNMVLAYNPEMEPVWQAKGIRVPRSFLEFASDPSLKGRISMGNPLTSGTSYITLCALLDKYGESYFDDLSRNRVMLESGSTAIEKLQSGECTAIMILEESVLKYIADEAANGIQVSNVQVIYPEDGVVLTPSSVVIVKEEYSKNANTEAAEAVARWLLTEEAQHLILKGYMHSTLAGMPHPDNSIDTETLIAMDIGVDWEKASRDREKIINLWTEKVTQR